MSETAKHTENQWPDNIVGGDIRYGRASNYDGFYLADASHGIPTFGSVAETDPATIRGQHVRVFNYPGQTEAIAAELVLRWNSQPDLLGALKAAKAVVDVAEAMTSCGSDDEFVWSAQKLVNAAIAKAEGR